MHDLGGSGRTRQRLLHRKGNSKISHTVRQHMPKSVKLGAYYIHKTFIYNFILAQGYFIAVTEVYCQPNHYVIFLHFSIFTGENSRTDPYSRQM